LTCRSILWRLDSRAAFIYGGRPLAEPPSAYLKRNLYVTTSGECSDAPLIATLASVGDDHVLCSVDYPYEDSGTARRFLEKAMISGGIRDKVGRLNAARLLRLAS
jgi:2,3-dihydroxybenzoate decarboxylase